MTDADLAAPRPTGGQPLVPDAAEAAAPPGLRYMHRGKVRDLYRVGDGRLVMLASDRISAYDYVLATPIPDKGRVLTALSVWWFDRLSDRVGSHFITADDPVIPPQWRGRAMVCAELDMIPVEAVARGYLTGSGFADYRATGAVCGVSLPTGLRDGDRLPEPVFTPASKAPQGAHDENVSFEAVEQMIGPAPAARLRDLTLTIYATAARIAGDRGIILADTKFEFGLRRRSDVAGAAPQDTDDIVLGDEVLTPDSSRFWPADQWRPGRPQPSYDKQFVRDWLTSPASGWRRDSGEPPPALPDDVVEQTRLRYIQAYETLTGAAFEDWPG